MNAAASRGPNSSSVPHLREAGLSLGANLGDRRQALQQARLALQALPHTHEVSCAPIYETEPVEVCAAWQQCLFYNTVIVLATLLDLDDFAARLRALETALGRVRGPDRHAPRTIDIDLLYFGDLTRDTPQLRLPHPHIAVRRFVCQPLADLRPHLCLPGQTRTVQELLMRLSPTPRVWLAAEQWL